MRARGDESERTAHLHHRQPQVNTGRTFRASGQGEQFALAPCRAKSGWPEQSGSQPANPQPVNPQPRVNHLKIDSSEFKIAVEVPRLGMDRILHSAMLHGKLNDLLERGLISHDAARAAFCQAQHNQIGR